MKKYLILSAAFVAVFALMGFYVSPKINCNAKNLKDKLKAFLAPYKYDSAELTQIAYKNEEFVKETEVAVFVGEKYKLAFNTEALPIPIEINIYDKDLTAKKRKLLFSNKTLPFGTKLFMYEPQGGRRLYVDYVVPKLEVSDMGGCVIFMLGFKNN